MTTIAEELAELRATKAAIRQAIIEKGVDVPESELIDTYHDYIDLIGADWLPEPGVYDLPNLKKALNTGNPAKYFPVGTEVSDTWSGQPYPLIVASYGNIELATGEIRLGVWLVRKNCTADEGAVGTADYAQSGIQSWLDGAYASACSQELQSLVATIKVVTQKPQSASTSILNTKYFFPSLQQLGGNTGLDSMPAQNIEGEAWEYFSNPETTGNANDRRIFKTIGGVAKACWTRSANQSTANSMWYVTEDGSLLSGSPTVAHASAPACVIVADDLNTPTFANIKKAMQNAHPESVFPIGTKIADVFANRTPAPAFNWVLVDYGTATLANGESVKGAYFMSDVTLASSEYGTSYSGLNYGNSSIHNYLNGGSTYTRISDMAKEVATTIKVQSLSFSNGQGYTTSEDQFFIPSVTQVSGVIENAVDEPWEYFKNYIPQPTNDQQPARVFNGGEISSAASHSAFWTRDMASTQTAYRVSEQGAISSQDAKNGMNGFIVCFFMPG